MRNIILTKDGSHTIHDPSIGESYHSVFGALTESRHVFIQEGLKSISQSLHKLKVFEIGFGTGLNAWLTYLETESTPNLRIQYTTIDAFPLEFELIKQLNYPDFLGGDTKSSIFYQLHNIEWGKMHAFSSSFTFLKHLTTLESYLPDEKYHLIYFDAFSPSHQASLWTSEILEKISGMMHTGGLLVSYCARGAFRRNLLALGFDIEKVPGPPGKREMTRAWFRG